MLSINLLLQLGKANLSNLNLHRQKSLQNTRVSPVEKFQIWGTTECLPNYDNGNWIEVAKPILRVPKYFWSTTAMWQHLCESLQNLPAYPNSKTWTFPNVKSVSWANFGTPMASVPLLERNTEGSSFKSFIPTGSPTGTHRFPPHWDHRHVWDRMKNRWTYLWQPLFSHPEIVNLRYSCALQGISPLLKVHLYIIFDTLAPKSK